MSERLPRHAKHKHAASAAAVFQLTISSHKQKAYLAVGINIIFGRLIVLLAMSWRSLEENDALMHSFLCASRARFEMSNKRNGPLPFDCTLIITLQHAYLQTHIQKNNTPDEYCNNPVSCLDCICSLYAFHVLSILSI